MSSQVLNFLGQRLFLAISLWSFFNQTQITKKHLNLFTQ